MLDRYFQRSPILRRLHAGPAGPYLETFAATLHAGRFCLKRALAYLLAAAQFLVWCGRRGVPITEINDQLISQFQQHVAKCRCLSTWHHGYRRSAFRIRRFVDHLKQERVIAVTDSPALPDSRLVERYCSWMRYRRGLTSRTLLDYTRHVREFLVELGDDPSRYDAAGIRRFVLKRARRSGPALGSALRGFLKHLVAQGLCSADLIAAVPIVRRSRLARLPGYLQAEEVERVIKSCDLRSRSGVRDRAMLLLLARLGLRAGDVTALRLPDIDWKRGRLRLMGKGRRETWLPLPQDVGDAILSYLKGARPAVPDDHVFLRVQAPVGPLRCSNALSGRVKWAMKRAGVEGPSHGAHLLRHSLATRMLREGASLDCIGALLRHRNMESTAIYSKVDVDLLRQVALPWPVAEVGSC